MKVFTNAGNDHLAALGHRGKNPFDRNAETAVNLVSYPLKARDFQIHHFLRPFLKIHYFS